VYPDLPLTIDSFIVQYDIRLARLWSTVTPLPGAHKLVQHLHAQGVPMALATGSRRKNYVLKTKHLEDLFRCFDDRVVCGDDLLDGMKGKPAPDIFLMAAREKLGLDVGSAQAACTDAQRETRSKVLVFEDGISGFQGAKRAGMSGKPLAASLKGRRAEFLLSCLGTRCQHLRRRVLGRRKTRLNYQLIGEIRTRGMGFATLQL